MVEVRFFGSFAVGVDGRWLGPRDFGGVKPKQLLELLVLRRGRVVSKDELIESLWPESRPRNGTAAVESYVSVVRARLADARALVRTESGGYRIDPGGLLVDLDEFDALLREAAGSPAVRRGECLEEALVLVSGEVLADEPYAAWALDVRGIYAERRVQALGDLADARLALSDFDSARERTIRTAGHPSSSSSTSTASSRRGPPAQALRSSTRVLPATGATSGGSHATCGYRRVRAWPSG